MGPNKATGASIKWLEDFAKRLGGGESLISTNSARRRLRGRNPGIEENQELRTQLDDKYEQLERANLGLEDPNSARRLNEEMDVIRERLSRRN